MTRGVAGRRVLQVVLLVGGLFVLGFLCGEQAHAADGTSPEAVTVAVTTSTESVRSAIPAHAVPGESTAKSTAPGVEDSAEPTVGISAPTHPIARATGAAAGPRTAPTTTPTVPTTTTTATDAVATVTGTVGHVVRPVVQPVGEHVVRPVTEQVVRPVGDVVETVTGGPAGEPSPFPPLPGMPSLPGLPEVPSLPELPGLPSLPGLPGIPANILPIGAAPQQPGGAAPEQPGAAERGDGSEVRPAARAGAGYGPRFAHAAEADVSGARVPQGVDTVRTPPHQAPGDEAGALGRHSAVDNGGSRHCEPHAVTLDHRAPLSRVLGVTAVVAADGTRDRHRDIPEFPG
ncbi:hypothetical protein ACH40E_15400 [Streptomyces acidicola]|uniref:hypothetical protein n=1 Tax=Streptomyces acidicola TaxID=2596892 RepID=UPI0037879BB9